MNFWQYITYMLWCPDQYWNTFVEVGHTRNQEYIDAFGAHVKKLRVAKKLSRETLAAYAGIEVMQIYRIETGKINTTISTLLSIANALEISPKKLLDFEF